MIDDTTPSLRDRIQPDNPKLVKKKKKQAMNVIDNERWIMIKVSGT